MSRLDWATIAIAAAAVLFAMAGHLIVAAVFAGAGLILAFGR